LIWKTSPRLTHAAIAGFFRTFTQSPALYTFPVAVFVLNSESWLLFMVFS
jgi:hypothetical protein